MASSIPSGSGGHSVRLPRIDGARQNQQERSKGTSNAYAGQAETYHAQQAAYLQGYYSDRQAAGVAAQETLSPSHSSNSSPRKLLQSRRQNMMQRRIEMRLRSEERQRQQQQVQHSYGILPSRNNQNPLTRYETHPTQYHAHCQSQSQPQHQVGQQARHMLHSQSGTNQLNMYSKVRGKIAQRNDSSMHHQENVSCHRQNYPQTYPISSQKQQRPPSYSNPPTNLQYPHQNSHPGTQHQRRNIPYADERQQQSPIVTSPPELDRRQIMPLTTRNVGEYPSANLFDGYKNGYTGHYQSADEHGEGIEIEAQHFLHLVSTQGNASRLPSSRESPSDECLVEEGYYEDRYPQSQNHTVGSHEQQELYKGTTHVSNLPHRQTKQQFTHQQKQIGPIDESKEKKQNQLHPDWHQLNRNRLYQKKFAARYHNAASNSSPKSQAQSLLQTRPPKKTSIANFSPIESLSTRTDQIQRKHRQPLHGESGEPMENIDPLHNGQDQRRELPDESEESVASVLDRARSFEANIAGKNQVNVGGSRSRSVPRERTSHWSFIKFHQANDESRVNVKDPGFGGDRGRSRATLPSQESLTQYIDDDTVTESVASRKKEWEGKLQSSQQRKARSTHESEAFSVWAERADRLAQQRKSEQRSEQRRSIDEKWRRSAVKSLPPERRNHERGSGVYGYDARYSQEERYRGEEYQFVTQKHLGQDQHSIEQDASLMSIEDRRRMLWDGKERLRAVLPKSFSFESPNRLPENNSPGTVGSAGSTFFKSKFVHAAAVATQQKANFVEDGNQTKRVISPKRHLQKAGAVSSHFTDSTAGTTPVGSNGSSHRTHSTNLSRIADPNGKPPTEYNNQMQTQHYDNHRHPKFLTDSCSKTTEKNQGGVAQGHGNKISVMPSIAETPRLSVAELIARINAVSRSNPAEALAAIDSIIKAESGVSNSIKSRPIQQTQSNSPPSRPSETNTIKPCPKDFFQSKYKEVVQETTEKNLDDEESESFYSSEDSTVSSMTNPTYLSLPAHCPPSVAHSTKQTVSKPHAEFTVIQDTKKQPKYSPQLFDDLEVQSTKKSSEVPTSAQSPQDKNHGAARQTSSSYSHYQNQKSDEAVYKLFSGSEDETGKRRVVKTTVGGENQRLTMLRSTSKTKSEDDMLSPSTKEDSKAVQQPSNGKNADKAWVAVPETKYFQPASNTSHSKPLTDKKQKGGERKPSIDSTVQQQQKNESKYISHSELSQGQSIGLPSVVSDAFSGIDIDLDDGPVSNLVHYQPHSTVSEAFSGVDIDLEPTKTVSQRRQDFEYQTRSWNQKSPGGEEDQQIPPISKEKEIRSKVDSNQGWAMTPKDKKKAKVEPTLRLKGSKMLAQKFANLVKAFESDAY